MRTAGPPHLSLSDRGVSITTNGDRALCLSFHEPVPAIDPTATIAHPGATIAAATRAGWRRRSDSRSMSSPGAGAHRG